jgi:hypothetical protein
MTKNKKLLPQQPVGHVTGNGGVGDEHVLEGRHFSMLLPHESGRVGRCPAPPMGATKVQILASKKYSVSEVGIYINTYIQTYIHTYKHTNIQTYKHTCIHTYIHTYIHKYIHTYICAFYVKSGGKVK